MAGIWRRPPQPQQRRVFAAPPLPPGGGLVGFCDDFARSVSAGNNWGSGSEITWTKLYPLSAETEFSVSGGKGLITQSTLGNTFAQGMGQWDDVDADMKFMVRTDKLASGQPQEVLTIHRWVDVEDYYNTFIRFNTNQTISAGLNRTQSAVWSNRKADTTIGGLTHAANTDFWVRIQIDDVIATPTVKLKVWQDGTSEPGSWSWEFTDSGSTQGGTTHGVGQYIETGTLNTPVTFAFDEFCIGEIGFNDPVSADEDVDAELIAVSALASQAWVIIAPRPAVVAATGAASNASIRISAQAVVATATGVAGDVDVIMSPRAVVAATATGASLNVIPLVKPNTGLASGTGSALSPPGPLVRPTALAATATGAAQTSSEHIKVNAAVATATGAAYDATFSIPAAETADADTAIAIGAASNAAILVKPNAGVATSSGAAANATGKPDPVPDAVAAIATGAASNASILVKPNAVVATASGLASIASAHIKPNAGLASATGAASNAGVSTTDTAPADTATATGLALNASVRVSANAAVALATGTAINATGVPGHSAAAVTATATGLASNPLAHVRPNAGLASATGAASGMHPHVAAGVGLASAVGAALTASAHVQPTAELAAATGAASDATTTTDAQYLRPIADLSGNWHGEDARTTTLYTSVDDDPFNDATYIESPDGPTSSDFAEFDLPTAGDPVKSTGHVVRYRYGGEGVATLVVELRQGSTVIASWSHVDPTTPTLVEQVLTEAEADSITDYSDLRVRVRAA